MPYRAESLPAGTVTFLSGHRRELGDRLGFARALEGVAAATGAIGNSLRAARILGAAQRLREEIGTPLSPADLPATISVSPRRARRSQMVLPSIARGRNAAL